MCKTVSSARVSRLPERKKINLEEKNVELKIPNWICEIGEIAELKTANGQSIA